MSDQEQERVVPSQAQVTADVLKTVHYVQVVSSVLPPLIEAALPKLTPNDANKVPLIEAMNMALGIAKQTVDSCWNLPNLKPEQPSAEEEQMVEVREPVVEEVPDGNAG